MTTQWMDGLTYDQRRALEESLKATSVLKPYVHEIRNPDTCDLVEVQVTVSMKVAIDPEADRDARPVDLFEQLFTLVDHLRGSGHQVMGTWLEHSAAEIKPYRRMR